MSVTDGGGDAPGEDDRLRARATNSIGWVAVERWTSRLVSLGVFTVLARLLAPEQFGLISLATVFTALLMVFVDSGFTKALIQAPTLEDKDASTAFWTSLGLSVVLYVALFFSAPLLGVWLGEPELAPVLQVMGAGLILSALSQTPAALLERSFAFKKLSIRQIIGTAAGAVAAITVALLGGGVWALASQVLVTSAVSVIALWASTSWRPRLEYSVASLRRLWSVGVGILGISLIEAIQANIDKLLIGAFFSAEELGYYFLAQRIGLILIELVTSVIARVSLTTFSRVQDDLPRLNRILRQMTFAASAVGFPVFAFVAVFAAQIVPVVFGEGWDAAVPILWILAPGWAVATVMFFDRNVLVATRHVGAAFGLSLAQNLVSIALVFAFLPLGVIGVAFSRLARIVTWPIRMIVMHRLIALPVLRYLAQVGRVVVAIGPVAAVIGVLQLTGWAQSPSAFWTFALPVGIVGAAVYAGVLWLIAGEENRVVLRPLIAGLVSKLSRRKR